STFENHSGQNLQQNPTFSTLNASLNNISVWHPNVLNPSSTPYFTPMNRMPPPLPPFPRNNEPVAHQIRRARTTTVLHHLQMQFDNLYLQRQLQLRSNMRLRPNFGGQTNSSNQLGW